MLVSVQDQCRVTILLLHSWFSLPDKAQFCHGAGTCGCSQIMLAVSMLCQGTPCHHGLGQQSSHTTPCRLLLYA